MMPHCKRDSQFELFAGGLSHSAEPSARLELPFQRSAEVDVRRVCHILGTNKNTVIRMCREQLLAGSYQIHGSKCWRIPYSAVVDYCNRLRVEYRIGSRAVVPAPGKRVRDDALLPFPLADTIAIEDVRQVLDCGRKAVLYMIDEGVLVAYQLKLGAPESPWRIYRTSLERYLESLRARVGTKPAYGSPLNA
jgi:hypothetical protein